MPVSVKLFLQLNINVHVITTCIQFGIFSMGITHIFMLKTLQNMNVFKYQVIIATLHKNI